jgi:signal transduction histidine kinase
MDTALAATVVAAQDILVLRHDDHGLARSVHPIPAWVQQLATPPNPIDGPFSVIDVFPYLEARMPDFEAFWNGDSTSPARTEVWTELGRDGGDIPLQATALAAQGSKILLIRRVTEEHATQQRMLQAARAAALDHERLMAELSAKDVLLHCVIHDLAGPLAGIKGCLELLEQGPLDSAQTELVRIARLQARRQGRLIRDVLDVFASQVTSMERFQTDAVHAPDLRACAQSVAEGLRPAFLIKRVELRTDFSKAEAPRLPVIAEQSRLERVFYNLVENALRFAPPDTAVTIQIADEDPEPWITATIMDEGPGVRPEILPRLFQRFVSGGKSPGKSGLGLFFCRIALERWGGSIRYDSESGPGARFVIRLRKAKRQPPTAVPASAAALAEIAPEPAESGGPD